MMRTEDILILTGTFAFVVSLIGWMLWDMRKQKQKRKAVGRELLERKQQKLMSTQQNVARRIRRAMKEGLPTNYQWGNRLDLSSRIQDGSSLISLHDTHRPVWSILWITTICRFDENVVQVTIHQGDAVSFNVTGPNDVELTLFIGRQLDFIQNWSPIPPTPTAPIAA